jgi:two-component system phosphate regulon response regulator PhoB/two-component system alkaline phosphatase synthesis response regulator PhoP
MLKQNPSWKDIPVLILTAKGDETDIVLGLEFGADDYIVKPFSPKELVARIRAVLRRKNPPEQKKSKEIRIGDILIIDLNRHEVYVRNRKTNLTKTEFIILNVLAEKPGWVFSREKLLTRLWGDDKFVIDRTIDVHIKNLRDKLGDVSKWVKNVRGVGYKLEP